MSSIKSLMGGASNAMGAHKASLALTSKNIANANTPGYTRQRMNLMSGTMGLMTASRGNSLRSVSLQRSILGAQQAYGFHAGRLNSLQLAEPGLNDLDGVGVSAAIDSFFQSLSQLAGNPSGVGERQDLLAKARALANAVNVAANGIVHAREAAEQDASVTVDAVNRIVTDIAVLNGQIDTTNAQMGQDELIDQRDVLLNELAQHMELSTVEQDDGTVLVFTAGGQPLVQGDQVSKMALTGGGTDPLGLQVVKPDGGTITMTDPPGGMLGGLMDARDDTLLRSLDELDQMAFSLAEEMNTLHSGGTALDGTTGHNFFQALTGPAGAAQALAVDPTVNGNPDLISAAADPSMLPGDDAIIQQMLALQSGAIVNGKTLTESYDVAASTVTHALQEATSRADASAARLNEVMVLRDSQSAVSISEEMVELNAAERAFDAVSKVFDTANQLYEVVLQMV